MTNYESTVYTVEDEEQGTAAAFSTTPPSNDPGGVPESHAVMKLWHTAELPDGQSINVSVLFTFDDVRGLQSYLNDQFGRGEARIGAHRPADVPPTDLSGNPRSIQHPDNAPGLHAADHIPLRQCPVIYNGVQCHKAEGHHDSQGQPDYHEFVDSFLPQTGDGTVSPPATPTDGATSEAAESAPAAGTDEVPSPSAECTLEGCSDPRPHYHTGDDEMVVTGPYPQVVELLEGAQRAGEIFEQAEQSLGQPPAKKKVNRRKKEEKAYDDALEAFRKQPNSQLEYTALTQAAEALRKRFPDASRLEAYDEHVRLQNVDPLLEKRTGTPAEMRDPAAGSPTPQFAPEPVAAQPTPFIPPATTEHPNGFPLPAPEQQTPEELQAAAAFPCQHVSTQTGRQCTRPAGHELANPPKPHIYPELQPGQALQVPSFTDMQPVQAPGFTVAPVADGQGFTQQTIPPFQIPQPVQTATTQGAQVLSFQVPPTPEVQGAELQPPAPAAPPWGGQQ